MKAIDFKSILNIIFIGIKDNLVLIIGTIILFIFMSVYTYNTEHELKKNTSPHVIENIDMLKTYNDPIIDELKERVRILEDHLLKQ